MKIKFFRTKKDIEIGIDTLCKNKNLVIKGGGIVILDRKDYMQEMYRIIGDVETYTPLPSNPNDRYKGILEKIVMKGFDCDILNKKEKAFLVPKAPKIPILYYLPKVHKSLTCPLGRPIVSGIDSVTSGWASI